MDDKKAVKILMEILDKYRFSAEEKKALEEAIGILSWTSLSKSGLKTKKERIKKSTNWQ